MKSLVSALALLSLVAMPAFAQPRDPSNLDAPIGAPPHSTDNDVTAPPEADQDPEDAGSVESYRDEDGKCRKNTLEILVAGSENGWTVLTMSLEQTSQLVAFYLANGGPRASIAEGVDASFVGTHPDTGSEDGLVTRILFSIKGCYIGAWQVPGSAIASILATP